MSENFGTYTKVVGVTRKNEDGTARQDLISALSPGDPVEFECDYDNEHDENAAVLIDGGEAEATLKRVYKAEGQITLMSANPAYAPFVYVGADMAKVRIIGKAVAFTSAVR